MSQIELELPPGARMHGELRTEYATDELDQDILQITLDNGRVIDVGWSPEYDRNGAFDVVVFRGEWDNRTCGPFRVKSTEELADWLRFLIDAYNREITPVIVESSTESFSDVVRPDFTERHKQWLHEAVLCVPQNTYFASEALNTSCVGV